MRRIAFLVALMMCMNVGFAVTTEVTSINISVDDINITNTANSTHFYQEGYSVLDTRTLDDYYDKTHTNSTIESWILNNRIISGIYSDLSDFPNVIGLFTFADSGHSYFGNIGLVGESSSNDTDVGIGLGGVSKTSGTRDAIGVAGRILVNQSSDTTSAIAIAGYSNDTHAGGTNIGIYSTAQNGLNNYAFYGANGLLYNNGNITISTGSKYQINGIDLACSDLTDCVPNAWSSYDNFTDSDLGDIKITAGVWTVDSDSVELSTDTTGNYVATVADAGESTITVTGSGSEGATITLDLANDSVSSEHIKPSTDYGDISSDVSGNLILDSNTVDNDELVYDTGQHLTTTSDVTHANVTSTGYFFGQPIVGGLGSGVIWCDDIDSYGNINLTVGVERNITYPNMIVRIVTTENEEYYCNISTATVNPTNNQQSIYYVNNDCSIVEQEISSRLSSDISPTNGTDIFTVMTHENTIEVYKGVTMQNKIDTKVRRNIFYTDHMKVVSGLGLTEETFPNYSLSSGRYIFLRDIVDTTLQNTTNLDSVELISKSGGDWTYTQSYNGINLTACISGDETVTCSNPTLYRRYFIFLSGFDDGTDRTQLHQLLALEGTTYANIADCENVNVNPLTYTLPDLYEYSAVPLYAYCGRASATDWTGVLLDLRTSDISTVTTGIDTSIFLDIYGSRPLQGNWATGDYNLTSTNGYYTGNTLWSKIQGIDVVSSIGADALGGTQINESDLNCTEITGSSDLCDGSDADTTYTASGTLLDLTGTTFSVNEGTLTNGKGCKYVTGTGLVCDQDYLTASPFGESIDDTEMTAEDFGEFTCTGDEDGCTLDSGVYDDEYIELGDTFSGDVTGPYDATVVSDDSHNHSCSNITGATSNLCTLTDTNTQLSEEQVEDYVGGMVTGNTETLITVTYQDSDGTIDYVVNNDLHSYSWTNVVDSDIPDAITVTGYMQDTDIDTFSELNTWVIDATLLKSGGTLTNTYWCRYDGSGIDCDVNPSTYYTASETDTQISNANTSMKGYVDGELAGQDECSEITNCVPNAWDTVDDIASNSLGGTQINESDLNCTEITGSDDLCDGTDADTTYSAGTGLELTSTTFSVNESYINETIDARDDDTTYTASGTLLDLTGTAFSLKEGTLTDTKGCKFTTANGLVCDQDYLTSVADDSHNHTYATITPMTEAELYGILTDVTQFYEVGDKVGDADTLDTHDSSYFQTALTFGIANTNAVQIDSADVADNDFAKFTASGLEGRSYTEVKQDLSLDAVENTALSTWAGTSNITTVGTLTSGALGTGFTAVNVAQGGTGASSLTDHSVLVGSGTDVITALTVGTNGQLLVGSTGADPVFATLNCDNGLTCTAGAGTLEIDLDQTISGNMVFEDNVTAQAYLIEGATNYQEYFNGTCIIRQIGDTQDILCP